MGKRKAKAKSEGVSKHKLLAAVRKSVGATSGTAGGVNWWIDSGNYALNWVLSGDPAGGYPGGRVVEMFGDPSTGKSLLVYHMFAEAQKIKGYCFYDDAETSHEPFFATRLGVDCEDLSLLSSATVTEHANAVDGIVKGIRAADKKTPVVIALDALAILSTTHEATTEFTKRDMTRAQDIHKFFRLHSRRLAKNDVLYVVTNHQIANLVRFGPSKTTPGGSGPKYQASIRLGLSRREFIKQGAKEAPPIGVRVIAQAVKNKVTSPFKMAPLNIYYSKGMDRCSGLLDVLVAVGIAKDDTKRAADEKGRKGLFAKPVKSCKFGRKTLSLTGLSKYLQDETNRDEVFGALEDATA